MQKKEAIGTLSAVDLVEVYENRNNLNFESKQEKSEYISALLAEMIHRYIDNTKYDNNISSVIPFDYLDE